MQWHLDGSPYQVQDVALHKAGGSDGFAYLMEMGLGKSAVFLNEAVDLLMKGETDEIAVVCPPSLRLNWRDEVNKWKAPLAVGVWPNTIESSSDPILNVLNYEAISGGAQRGYSFLHERAKSRRLMVGLDESVQIKNHKSVRTRNLLTLSPFLSHRRILSGAPITQGPHDAWAQLRFIGALRNSNYYGFRNRFCKMGGWMGKQVVGTRNSADLYSILDQWGFRARKTDWTDLPEKIFTCREVDLTIRQREAYKEMAEAFVAYVNGEHVEAAQVVTQLLKLQQITSGFIINENKETLIIEETPPKLKVLHEILDEVTGKVLIFTHFRHTTTQLVKQLQDRCRPALMIGGMGDDAIAEQKRRFEHDSECRAFVIQTTTGKYGHTLLGGEGPNNRCSTTVFYENSFDLDARLQAEDRNHRHGQDRAVVYVDLVSSPVDTKAIAALQNKLNIASEVVDGVRKG